MKTRPSIVWAAALIVCAMSTQGFAKEKVNPSGTWRWEYDMQGETRLDALQLNLKDDGTVVGTYIGNRENEIEIKDGKFENGKLSLMVPIELDGLEIEANFSGEIEADGISGNVSANVNGESYDFPWEPKRSVKADDLLGKWAFKIMSPDGNELEPSLTVKENDAGDLEGEYVSQLAGKLEIEKLELKDNHLVLHVATQYEGTDVKVHFKARPYGNKMSGKFEYDFAGETGEGDFTAVRKAKK